jgi:hypothetical protein
LRFALSRRQRASVRQIGGFSRSTKISPISFLSGYQRILEMTSEKSLLGGDFGNFRSQPPVPSSCSEKISVSMKFSLLLAHQPRSVFAASAAGYDLQLSGHTHAGQYFPMSVLIHLMQPYVSGLNQHEAMQIYVSRGTGYWGPPNRAGSPSEITALTLRAV